MSISLPQFSCSSVRDWSWQKTHMHNSTITQPPLNPSQPDQSYVHRLEGRTPFVRSFVNSANLVRCSLPVIMGTLAPYTEPRRCSTMGLPAVALRLSNSGPRWLSTPIVSSKVIALMFSEARMASLSASVGSSLLGTFADNMQHISHRLTLTARRSARLSGDPLSTEILGRFCSIFHSRLM